MRLQRKKQPKIRPVELENILEPESVKLDNGIPLYTINSGEEDLLRIDFLFDAGQVRENLPLVASTANAMLLEGSENYNAKEINSAFDFYGTYITPFIQKDLSGLTVFLLNKHLGKIAELCREIIYRPVFPEYELDNLQNKRLQVYLMNRRRTQNLASDKFFESIFGPDHPYGRQIYEADFKNVKRSMLIEFHHNFYYKGPSAIIISGKIHGNERAVFNDLFGRHVFDSGNADIKKIKIKSNKIRKAFVIKEDAVQSAIRIGSATINRRHPDYNGLFVTDTILGGFFGSRLMKNLREEKGYTYGVHSSLMSLQQSGYKTISTEVGKEYTEKALDEIYKEIMVLQNRPVEKKELDIVKNYMSGEIVRMFDGPFATAESFRAVMEFGFGNDYYFRLFEKIRTIDPDEIMAFACKYYNIGDLYEVVAGPE